MITSLASFADSMLVLCSMRKVSMLLIILAAACGGLQRCKSLLHHAVAPEVSMLSTCMPCHVRPVAARTGRLESW